MSSDIYYYMYEVNTEGFYDIFLMEKVDNEDEEDIYFEHVAVCHNLSHTTIIVNYLNTFMEMITSSTDNMDE